MSSEHVHVAQRIFHLIQQLVARLAGYLLLARAACQRTLAYKMTVGQLNQRVSKTNIITFMTGGFIISGLLH